MLLEAGALLRAPAPARGERKCRGARRLSCLASPGLRRTSKGHHAVTDTVTERCLRGRRVIREQLGEAEARRAEAWPDVRASVLRHVASQRAPSTTRCTVGRKWRGCARSSCCWLGLRRRDSCWQSWPRSARGMRSVQVRHVARRHVTACRHIISLACMPLHGFVDATSARAPVVCTIESDGRRHSRTAMPPEITWCRHQCDISLSCQPFFCAAVPQ